MNACTPNSLQLQQKVCVLISGFMLVHLSFTVIVPTTIACSLQGSYLLADFQFLQAAAIIPAHLFAILKDKLHYSTDEIFGYQCSF